GLIAVVTLWFFFSSRRRHTRCYRDWSSDVCSSDLSALIEGLQLDVGAQALDQGGSLAGGPTRRLQIDEPPVDPAVLLEHGHAFRSEERRVGKESRTGRTRDR